LVSLQEWVQENNDGVEPEEQDKILASSKELWLEICTTLQSENGAHLIERVKEEKTMIVADLTSREIAEKKMRRVRGTAETSSLADAMVNLDRQSLSTSEALQSQYELRARLESERLIKQDAWKQKEVRVVVLLMLLSMLMLLLLVVMVLLLLMMLLILPLFHA
jgi:hypothetical protein